MRRVRRRVTDLFRYVTQQPNLKPESYLGDGTQFADLRGLGFDTHARADQWTTDYRDCERADVSMRSI